MEKFNFATKIISDSSSETVLRRNVKIFLEVAKEYLEEKEYKKPLQVAIRKALKNIGENRDERLFVDCPHIVNQGIRETDYSSWTTWYLFNVDTVEQAREIIENSQYSSPSIYIEPDTFYSDYDCTGRMFSDEMEIRKVGKNRVLATKWHGLDV